MAMLLLEILVYDLGFSGHVDKASVAQLGKEETCLQKRL